MIVKHDAFTTVVEAATIHANRMQATVTNKEVTGSFADVRRSYIGNLRKAIEAVKGTRFEDAVKVSERVADLDLAESVALMHAVEDHIRTLVGRSPLA